MSEFSCMVCGLPFESAAGGRFKGKPVCGQCINITGQDAVPAGASAPEPQAQPAVPPEIPDKVRQLGRSRSPAPGGTTGSFGLSLALGVAASLALGYAYSWIYHFIVSNGIPILHYGLPFILIGMLGWVAKNICLQQGLLNPTAAALLAAALGALTCYWKTVVWLHLYSGGGWVFEPKALYQGVWKLAEELPLLEVKAFAIAEAVMLLLAPPKVAWHLMSYRLTRDKSHLAAIDI